MQMKGFNMGTLLIRREFWVIFKHACNRVYTYRVIPYRFVQVPSLMVCICYIETKVP